MAVLSSRARNKLPPAAFAGPNRSFPVEDKAHAANAKGRAVQMVNKGKISPAAKARIVAKANKVLQRG